MVGRKEQEEGIQFRQRRWKERKGSEERMGGCKTHERRLWQCYLAMRLICMRSWPSQTSLRSHCIALRGITMVLYPMEKARKRSNQKPEASYPPSSFSTSPPPVILRPFLLSLSLVGGNTCLIIYAAQVAWNFTVSYIILAHTFLYTWTRVCYGGAHKAVYSQEQTGRYPRYVYVRIPTCTEVRASSVRELLLVGFLGHARQIPVGYIFSLGYPMGKWRRNGFQG